MRILLTNDDGIYAPGIAALKAQVRSMGEVVVLAPDAERSAVGHSITLDRPLRIREVYVGSEFLGYGVDGSPADCVKIGVKEILKEPPDLVLSGINLGSNLGINVLYSGTVAAALEGAILGFPSAAVSLAASKRPDFDSAARLAASLLRQITEKGPARGSLFNINIPARPDSQIKGVAVAAQSTVSYDDGFVTRTDPRGGQYFWMTGELNQGRIQPGTDVSLLSDGFITVTPLQYDLTDREALEACRAWNLHM